MSFQKRPSAGENYSFLKNTSSVSEIAPNSMKQDLQDKINNYQNILRKTYNRVNTIQTIPRDSDEEYSKPQNLDTIKQAYYSKMQALTQKLEDEKNRQRERSQNYRERSRSKSVNMERF